MSDHYCCKTCGLRYDDCTCGKITLKESALASTIRVVPRSPVEKARVAKLRQKTATVTPPEPARVAKCSAQGQLCSALEDRIEDVSNHRGKGIVSVCVMNFTTSEMFSPGLCYKKSAKDGGLMLNFCPFCGTNLTTLFKRLRSSSKTS